MSSAINLNAPLDDRRFSRRIFWTLWLAAVISFGAGLVPMIALLKTGPMAQLITGAATFALIVGLLFAVLVQLGLSIGSRIGLKRAPLLEAWVRGESVADVMRPMVAPAVLLGLAYLLFALVITDRVTELLGPPPATAEPPKFLAFGPPGKQVQLDLSGWTGFVVAMSFPVFEEIAFRLCFFAVFAWLIGKVLPSKSGGPSWGAFWLANLFQAALFALFHVPNGSTVWWRPWYIQAAAAPQFWLGLIDGFLYRRYGLEAAILSHVTSDLSVVFVLTALSRA